VKKGEKMEESWEPEILGNKCIRAGKRTLELWGRMEKEEEGSPQQRCSSTRILRGKREEEWGKGKRNVEGRGTHSHATSREKKGNGTERGQRTKDRRQNGAIQHKNAIREKNAKKRRLARIWGSKSV